MPLFRRRRPRALAGLVAGVLVALPVLLGGATQASAAASAAQLPPGFAQQVVAAGLDQPTSFAFLPDGRILVAQKNGLVRLVKNGVLVPTPFIDLRDEVNSTGDRGLLDVAADPRFNGNHYVYLLYVHETDASNPGGPKTGRLTRVTASGDTAPRSSEVVLLGHESGAPCAAFPAGSDCIPAEFRGHSMGGLAFARDGSLFVSLGDAATWQSVATAAVRAQSLDSLAGKILHVSATGAGLRSNPFWNGDPNAARSKVWAYGLRNAYRFTLRPGSGTVYAGDVGWNTTEEIDVVTRGANLGWPCYEGGQAQGLYGGKAECQALWAQGPGAVKGPLISYDHEGAFAAVTGGMFYSGSSYPAEYRGAYFFGDYVRDFIRYAQVDSHDRLVGGPFGFATGADGPVDVAAGPGGDLYYVAIKTGELRRIRYVQSGASARTTYLSDRRWKSASNGLGPIGRGGLALDGVAYAKGLAMHAPSDVRYALNGQCTAFDATVGIDDGAGNGGSVVFRVLADGVPLFDSGLVTGATAAVPVHVLLGGRSELELSVQDGGDGNISDEADWADARLTCSDTTPPAVTAISPGAGDVDADVDADPSASFSEPLDPASVTPTTATLTPAGGSTPLAATVSYDPAGKRIVLAPATPLDPGTQYTMRIAGGVNGVADVAGNPLAADTSWTFTTTTQPRTYLSDLQWASMTNGLGPAERDLANGGAAAGDGSPVSLRGVLYGKGLGVRAPSDIRYALGGQCTRFRADVGIDDAGGRRGSVDFQVLGDGVTLFDSGILTRSSPAAHVDVDVSGRNELRLLVSAGGSARDDLADWAAARVTCSGGSPPQPAIAQPTPAFAYSIGDPIGFSGSATDGQGHPIPPGSLTWKLLVHHCPDPSCEVDEVSTASGSTGSFTAPDGGDAGYLELVLTATDALGRTASTSVTLHPRTVQLTIATAPSGLQVAYQTEPAATAPIVRAVPVGATRTVTAPSPQGGLSFVSWSDGGKPSHALLVPPNDLTVTATLLSGPAPPTDLFADPISFPVGTNPHSVVAADVNGDGHLDLATADAGSDQTSVLLGHGDGMFGPATFFVTGPHPKFTVLTDLNRDKRLDLVTANQNDWTDTVRLGSGGGKFNRKSDSYPACAFPHNVAAGDLNGDGKPDVVTACTNGSVVSVRLGNGDGTLGPAASYSAGTTPNSVAIGDLNGDGKPDLATTDYTVGKLSVLLGNGDGSFQPPVTYPVGAGPHSVAIADLNGDNHPDVVTADAFADSVSVLLGHGDGTLAPAVDYRVGRVPEAVAVGDLNGDGKIDVVAGNSAGNGDGVSGIPNGDNVSVLLGKGDGTLGPAVTYRAGRTVFSVAVGDFNEDGRLDIATANWDDNSVSILLNAGAALGP